MRRMFAMFLMIGMTVAGAALAQAPAGGPAGGRMGPPPSPGGPHMPGMMHGPGAGSGAAHMEMMRALDLTDAQREKMADIRDRQQRKGIQARADIGIARLDLHKLIRAEKPDQAAINAQIDKIGALRVALAKSRVAAMLEVRTMLTPEQQKKYREMHMYGPMRMRMRMQMRERGAGGAGEGEEVDEES